MLETFKVLEITCPTCEEVKKINVPESIFSQKKFGTIKIQVPLNAVCSEHQFIVFVDTKGIIRGYEKIDMQMASITQEIEKETERRLNLKTLIQIFGVYGIFNLIHAKIFNYPIHILKDENFEFDEEILNSVGDMILPEKIRAGKTIYLHESSDINHLKIKDKDALIMDTQQHIFQTPWDTKLKFEEGIVKRALNIIDEQEQLRLLQQDIARLINEAKFSIQLLEIVKDIYEDELIDKISKKFKIKKINNYRFNLITEFIKRNVSKKLVLKIKNRVGEFLSNI
ncbi:MAG: hypothetical protein ACW972_04770 [Promethearchaeota archaeon]|jgi:hypothetical protein